MYACEGYILPVMDPDDNSSFDTLWDQLVPKDTDTQVINLDTEVTDTSPFYEPGEADWTALVDVGVKPERVYHRSRLLTMANKGTSLIFQDNQNPFPS